MSMKEHVNYAITKLSFSFSSSRVTPYGGLLIPGQMLSAIGFDRKVDRYTPPAKEYSNSDILKSMLIGILCGNTDFEAIHETDDDPEYFCNAFHMKHLPSEATMRQRMDEIGDSLRDTLRMANVSLFRAYGIEPSALADGYVPVDIDVSPFIDEKCCKEGVSRTCKCRDGYAPIFAYIGTEGYLLACELREGKQHCQKDTPAFLTEVLRLARQVTDQPLLFRLDSGNDSADNIGLFMEECSAGRQRTFHYQAQPPKREAAGMAGRNPGCMHEHPGAAQREKRIHRTDVPGCFLLYSGQHIQIRAEAENRGHTDSLRHNRACLRPRWAVLRLSQGGM